MAALKPRVPTLTKEFPCQCCQIKKKEEEFFHIKGSRVWRYSGRRPLFCRACIEQLWDEYRTQYGDVSALLICCAIIDAPYVPSQLSYTKDSTFAAYISLVNKATFASQSFMTSVVRGEIAPTQKEVVDKVDSKWSKGDLQNKTYATSVIGYDPFTDLKDEERRRCFNVFSSYCDGTDITSDRHRVQSIILIARTQLQIDKIDRAIDKELAKGEPDIPEIQRLSNAKKSLNDVINKLVTDNGLAAKYTKDAGAGSNTLGAKMQELVEAGVESARVDMFDIATCEAMQQMAAISAKAIAEQLDWSNSDYAAMVKEQRETIQELYKKNDAAEEEIRKLRNEIILLTSKPKSKVGGKK